MYLIDKLNVQIGRARKDAMSAYFEWTSVHLPKTTPHLFLSLSPSYSYERASSQIKSFCFDLPPFTRFWFFFPGHQTSWTHRFILWFTKRRYQTCISFPLSPQSSLDHHSTTIQSWLLSSAFLSAATTPSLFDMKTKKNHFRVYQLPRILVRCEPANKWSISAVCLPSSKPVEFNSNRSRITNGNCNKKVGKSIIKRSPKSNNTGKRWIIVPHSFHSNRFELIDYEKVNDFFRSL